MVWKVGDQLQGGKYEITDICGDGSFGTVYKAKFVQIDRVVVIKTPLEKFKNYSDYRKLVTVLKNEGEKLKQLSTYNHPNIVQVWDVFEEIDTYCIVINFIDGQTLFSLVKGVSPQPKPLTEEDALSFIKQIGNALSFMHTKGLVHRDAHPSNIMITSDGKAILIDFGLTVEIAIATNTYEHHGHKNFAPYEQRRGSAKPTVDVYALAASLYFAVTGEIPAGAVDRKLKNTRLVPPQEIIPSLSDYVISAITKGMEIEDRDRPKNMQAWLARLEQPVIIQPKPISPLLSQIKTIEAFATFARNTVPYGDPANLSKKIAEIPWGWLVWNGTVYAMIAVGFEVWGISLRILIAAPYLLAIAWALGLSSKWAVSWALTFTTLWFVGVLWALSVALVRINLWIGVVYVITVIVAPILVRIFAFHVVEDVIRWWSTNWSKTKNDLKSFSPQHGFLILLASSWIGLRLGWFLYRYFATTS
jgi:serine/threonine-protein kinase